MLFHRTRRKDHKINLVLQDDLISETNSLKCVGVIIDNKLKCHDHIMYIKTKYPNPLVLYTNPGNMLTMYITHLFFHISSTVVRYGVMHVRLLLYISLVNWSIIY